MFESTEERIANFRGLARKHCPLITEEFIEWLIKNNYFTAPASTKYHGAYEGGLYDHSYSMFKELMMLTDKLNLQWTRPESPFIVGMFHDLCKIDNYIKVEAPATMNFGSKEIDVYPLKKVSYEFNQKPMLKGHGDKSVMLLCQFMMLTQEEILCIRYHMGAYEKDDWDGFDAAIRKYPTTLFTHTADMIASKVDET